MLEVHSCHGNSYSQACRLALQHKLLMHVLENRVIVPNLAISGDDNILESGAGSGTHCLYFINMVLDCILFQGHGYWT